MGGERDEEREGARLTVCSALRAICLLGSQLKLPLATAGPPSDLPSQHAAAHQQPHTHTYIYLLLLLSLCLAVNNNSNTNIFKLPHCAHVKRVLACVSVCVCVVHLLCHRYSLLSCCCLHFYQHSIRSFPAFPVQLLPPLLPLPALGVLSIFHSLAFHLRCTRIYIYKSLLKQQHRAQQSHSSLPTHHSPSLFTLLPSLQLPNQDFFCACSIKNFHGNQFNASRHTHFPTGRSLGNRGVAQGGSAEEFRWETLAMILCKSCNNYAVS